MLCTGQYRNSILSLLFMGIWYLGIGQTAQLCVDVQDEGDEIFAYISISADENVTSAQFTVNWDSTQMSFQEAQPLDPAWDQPLLFGLNRINQGKMTVVWVAPDIVNGEPYPVQDTVVSIRFNRLLADEVTVNISNDPVPIEIAGNSGGVLKVETKDGLTNGALINGTLFITEAGQCDYDSTAAVLNQWQVAAISEDGRIFRSLTDDSGEFYFILPAGNFSIETVFPNRSWTQCQNISIENVDSSNQVIHVGVIPVRNCSDLHVDVAGYHLEACGQNKYTVSYQNWGTEPVDSAYIELSIDTLQSIVLVSAEFETIADRFIRIFVDRVDVNERGEFEIILESDCNLPEGSTHCIRAEIFPNTQCEVLNEQWSGASLEVIGTCKEDSVEFVIRNIGDADMIVPREFIITEDIVSFLKGNVQLNTLESIREVFVATGKTYHLEVEQVPFHPGNSIPRAQVEGCGPEPFSYGIVNQFEQNDRDPHISEKCLRTKSSFLPAELIAEPTGVSEDHFIRSSTELEYAIGFQNTGNTIIGDIEIIDTLSEYLDVNTLRLTGSSHLLKMAFLSDRIVKFSFPNINLASDEGSESDSRGFVQFKISQKADNVNGTLIYNRAMLRFDREGNTVTNQTVHQVSDNFFNSLGFYTPNGEVPFTVKAFPNPFSTSSQIVVTDDTNDLYRIQLIDVLGRILLEEDFQNIFTLVNQGWPEGMYLARIINSSDQQLVGKLYISN